MKNDAKYVWIVDDDMSVREIMDVILTEEGYNVRTYASEKELMQSFAHDAPSLLYLDILLSGADGRDIAKKLKSDSRYQSIPIIMMSANHRYLHEVNRQTVEDILTKPFEMNELLNKTYKFTRNGAAG